MEQTWRWFGPKDKVTLQDARQAGAQGIVTALHELRAGDVWPVEKIRERQAEVQAAGLQWTVVESLDLTEAVKTRGPGWQNDVAAFQQSLRNLGSCGIRTVAYNFMPVFSWMRTHLRAPVSNGGTATAFDATAFAAFDLHALQRDGAEADWSERRQQAARSYYDALSFAERDALQSTILSGLPGGAGSFTLEQVRSLVGAYKDIDDASLRANAGEFLRAVCPVAAEAHIRLCVHPDDPPRPLLGLPRIMSTANDLEWLLAQSPEESNGITFCTGAFGVRADNDLVAMVRKYAHRIGFTHLRSTQREIESELLEESRESFVEACHLEGDTDLVAIVLELVKEERRRKAQAIEEPLPFRADHGQELLNDEERNAHPGYPAVGRLRGLAELRGVMRAAEQLLPEGA